MLEWLQNNLTVVISTSIILIMIAILSLFKRTKHPREKQKDDEDISGPSEPELSAGARTPPPAKTTLEPEPKQEVNIPPLKQKEEYSEDIAVEILGDLDIKEESNLRPDEPQEINLNIPEGTDLQLPVDLDMQFIEDAETEIIPETETPAPSHDKKKSGNDSTLDNKNDFQLPGELDLEWPVEEDDKTK